MGSFTGLNWNDLRYLLAASRAGSLLKAARLTGVDETTVSRRISALETSLRARLTEKVEGKLILSELGRAILPSLELIESELDRVQSLVVENDGPVEGVVRISAIPLLMNRLLVPALPQLAAAHPALTIEAIAEPRNLKVLQREADLAIRLSRPDTEQRAMTRRIGNLDYAVYAAAGRDGAALGWISYDATLSSLPHARWIDQAIKASGGRPVLTVNDSEVALQAVRAGLGKSLLPTLFCTGSSDLCRLSGESPVLAREVWLISRPEGGDIRRNRVVSDWIERTIRPVGRAREAASAAVSPRAATAGDEGHGRRPGV